MPGNAPPPLLLLLLLVLALSVLRMLKVLAWEFGCWVAPPMMEVRAAARAAVKLGSDVMAAVAALTVSANDGGRACCTVAASLANCNGSACCPACGPENLDWLNMCGSPAGTGAG